MVEKDVMDVFNCIADIGADVLDLAENMVASDGLKYEPVSINAFSVQSQFIY